ncbi:fibronectin type III domain-containing protein, partial [bacterium]|nr:fibronectin type III domain-containing protein [bacterium]
SDTTMVLAWGPGSNPGGTPFLPELAIDAGFTVPIQVGWITANTTNFTGLSPNTTYYTRVRARNCDAVETAIIALET